MTTTEIVALAAAAGTLFTAIGTVIGVLVAQVIALRRAPIDNKKIEADSRKVLAEGRKLDEEADQVQVGTSLELVKALQGSLVDVRAELADIRLQNADFRSQLTGVRGQLADADQRAQISRIDVVRMGTQMDCERASWVEERRETVSWRNKLALVLGKLLSQLKAAGFQPELDGEDLEMLDKLVRIG